MSFLDDWNRMARDRHAAEVADGEHDDKCEWRPNGHFICNCSARHRIAAGYTEPPGELVHQYPLCPRCYKEVEHDGDCFACSRCCCYWPDPYGSAEFSDDFDDLSDSVAVYDRKLAVERAL